MQIAIQERLLPGEDIHERLQIARELGVDGVEFDNTDLTARVPEIADALTSTGLKASAVNTGHVPLMHPDFAARETAIVTLRQAMANTLDLGAVGVVFIPTHPDAPRLPDLHPYKSSIELEAEMLVVQLRATLADFAYAIGAELYMQPVNRYETHLVRRLEQAALVLRRNDDHPHIKIAAATFHMALEEDDLDTALVSHLDKVRYITLADHNNRLPGQGMVDFAALIARLRQTNYDGWLTLAPADCTMDAAAACVAQLRDYINA